MWFATRGRGGDLRRHPPVAIPLRGYVVCNKVGNGFARWGFGWRRNPLTGLCGLQPKSKRKSMRSLDFWGSQSPYGAMWFATGPVLAKLAFALPESQSPYGAMWFATRWTSPCRPKRSSRNPLTGLCGLQPELYPRYLFFRKVGVAIPLRGYVVCNSENTSSSAATQTDCRNPLTGLCGLQPKNLYSKLREW